MRELLGKLDRFDLADEYFGALGDLYAGKGCYGRRLLTDYFCVERAVDNNGLSHALCLKRIEKIAAARGKFGFYCVIYLVKHYYRLL